MNNHLPSIFSAKIIQSLLLLSLSGCSQAPPAVIGLDDGHLNSCPASPNCVNSEAEEPQHKINALTVNGPITTKMETLFQVISSMPRTQLQKREANYLWFSVKTPLMRFTDDLELLLDHQGKIQVRSASRLGHSDFNVNRKRVEQLRIKLLEKK